MSQTDKIPAPEALSHHSKSRILRIRFKDAQEFELPCEYLRIYSPAAEVKLLPKLELGKEMVNITKIEPQGNYAIRLSFDDGHDTGIYSWQTLYELATNYKQKWASYLQQLEERGYNRQEYPDLDKPRTISVLYVNYLVNKLHKDNETFELPQKVQTAEDFLHFLQQKKLDLGYLLADDSVRMTVNKQFAETFTRIDDGDEIGIIPNSPNPPKKG